MPAYRKLCDEPIAPCEVSNLSCLLNPWSQLMGRNGSILAVDVVVDGIMDVDVLALREVGVCGMRCGRSGWGVVGRWEVRKCRCKNSQIR